MLKPILLAAFMALSTLSAHADDSCQASNGSVTTGVTAAAKASFLQTVEHHWKFEFWRGAVCWGRPDDQYQDNQGFNGSSNQCVGQMTFKTNKDNMLNYTPMTLSWGANLTDGDTFTINLDDKRVQAAYDEVNGDCTSRKWGTKLEYASMTYDTRAVIHVPDDVWVVQVRATANVSPGSSIEDLQPQIGRESLKDDKNPVGYLQSLSKYQWTYLYVEPGEPLDVTIAYSNQRLSGERKYNVRYDFKFIGHNRCAQVLGDPKTVNYSGDYLKKVINSDIKTEDDYHGYAVKLGCMRNPVFLKAAMNNSRPDDLVPALKAMSDRTAEVLSQDHGSENEAYAAPFFATILDMSLVDVSRFALTDLLTYCKTYRDFTRETAAGPATTEVAGVEFMMLTYSHLEMIYNQLARQSLETLVNNLQTWNSNKITYAQMFDGNKDAQTALRAYQQAMVQMGLEIYTTIFSEITNRVPQAQIAKTYRDQLLSDLQSARTLANYVNVSIRQTLRDFGSRSNAVIDPGQLAANVKQLIALDAKIHDEMREYFKWFVSSDQGGDNGDQFVQTLSNLQTAVLRPSANNLSFIAKIENIKSLDEKFVRRAELNKLNQQVTECVFHPYGGGK